MFIIVRQHLGDGAEEEALIQRQKESEWTGESSGYPEGLPVSEGL